MAEESIILIRNLKNMFEDRSEENWGRIEWNETQREQKLNL